MFRNKYLHFFSNEKLEILYKQNCFNGLMFKAGFWVQVGVQ